jgi:hypothetical protein
MGRDVHPALKGWAIFAKIQPRAGECRRYCKCDGRAFPAFSVKERRFEIAGLVCSAVANRRSLKLLDIRRHSTGRRRYCK